MKYSFKRFVSKRGHMLNPARINITSKHMILFNANIISNYIKQINYVALHYDSQHRAIAFEFTKNKYPYSYKISNGGPYMRLITTKAFINQYSIPFGKYAAKYDSETGFLVVDLKAENRIDNNKE